jgi:hypothetical protein
MNKITLILVFLVIVLGISGIIIAEEFKEGIKLHEGKNTVNISFEFNPIYASDLALIYPEIATITYNDSQKDIGYVNVFGGIGDNFVIYPDRIYEITVKKEVNLNLK